MENTTCSELFDMYEDRIVRRIEALNEDSYLMDTEMLKAIYETYQQALKDLAPIKDIARKLDELTKLKLEVAAESGKVY